MKLLQQEKPWPRDPVTQVILGAEPFDFGDGSHAVLFLHGWTSTPRELRFAAQKIAAAGFRCRGILFDGHGRTLRALDGVGFREHLAQAERAFGELALSHDRVSICGLSMGGLAALHLAARRRVSSLVLLAPFTRPWGSTFGLPNNFLLGKVPLRGNIAKEMPGPINDPAGLEGHVAYHAMPAAELMTVVQGARDLKGKEGSITSPALILHSVNDHTSDFQGSLDLIKDLGSDDKTLVAFNRSNHILTLDFDRERVETEMVDWLRRRRDARSGS
jgi:carboxylesterase